MNKNNQDLSAVVQIADRVAQTAIQRAIGEIGKSFGIGTGNKTIPKSEIGLPRYAEKCPSYSTVMARINGDHFPYQAILRAFFMSSPIIRQTINPQASRAKAIYVVRNACNSALRALGTSELPAGVIERLLAPEPSARSFSPHAEAGIPVE